MFNNPPKDSIDDGIMDLVRTLLSSKKIKLNPIHQDMLITLVEDPRWKIIISQKYGIALPNVSGRVTEAIYRLIWCTEPILEINTKKARLVRPTFTINATRSDRRDRAAQIGVTLCEKIEFSDNRIKNQLQGIAELFYFEDRHNFTYKQLVTIPFENLEKYYSKHVLNKIDKILQQKNICLGMGKETADAYVAFAKKWNGK